VGLRSPERPHLPAGLAACLPGDHGIAGTKITWVWQISHEFSQPEALHPLWPGRNFVSMIGIDGYYETSHSTFHSIFGKTIKTVRTFTTKPILITETAVGQDTGRSVKIPGLFDGMQRFRCPGHRLVRH
jgi:hypothetical protein